MAVAQLVPAIAVARILRRRPCPLLKDDECPKAVIVMLLRGRDPFSADCLERVMDLDYPEYDVRLVIDHPNDLAWEVVNEVVARRPSNVYPETLKVRHEIKRYRTANAY